MATPAAMLSIMVKANGVAAATNDLHGLDDAGKRASGGLAKVAKVAAVGLAAGIGVGAVAVKGFIKAASESEVSSTKMQTQLKALGIDYGKHAKQIDTVIAKHSALSGFDDEDLQDSFTNIVRVTGDVNKAMKLNALVMDISRAKGISLEAASKMVSKAAAGQETAFSRLGIIMDKGATSQEAIAEAQKRFGGQAEAYGKTAAGAQERFGVAVENLQEALGQRLLPIVAAVANAVATFVNGMQTGEGAGGRFVAVIRGAVDWLVKWKDVLIPIGIALSVVAAGVGIYSAAVSAAAVVQGAFNAVLAANPIGIVVIALAALAAGLIYAYQKSETFREIVNTAFNAIKAVAFPVVNWLKIAIPDAWDIIRTATVAVWNFLKPYLEGIWNAIKVLVTTYFTVYKTIISGVWTAVREVTEKLWDWFGPYLKGIWEGVKTVAGPAFAAFKTIVTTTWDAIETITRTAWNAFKDLIVTPTERAVSLVRNAIGQEGLIGWLRDNVENIRKAADALAKPFVAAFKTMSDGVESVLGWLNKIVDAVKSVVEWIGKIKVPKISIPGIGDPAPGTPGGPVGGGSGLVGFGRHIQSMGYHVGEHPAFGGVNPVHSHYGPPDHYHGGALDINADNMPGGEPAALDRLRGIINQWVAAGKLHLWGPGVLWRTTGHYDHMHLSGYASGALSAASGLHWVGERGPELVNFRGGERVYNNRESMGMAGGDGMVVEVYIGGQKIDERVDVRIRENDRAMNGAYRAGLA